MIRNLLCSALLALGILPLAHADEASQARGEEIAARADRSDRGFGDSEVQITMVLRNAGGQESRRTLSQRTLEVAQDALGDRTLVVFDSPRDINGTALLSHSKILDADDQWLYLPAFKRIKRISSVNKDGAFVGSEFSYEDFSALEFEKFSYTFLRAEACGELMCDVVERLPRYEHSGYSKQIAWIDQEVYQVRRVEFYDRAGERLKVLSLEEYRQYGDQYWRPHRMAMVNLKTNKSTDMLYSDYRFANGLSERHFVKGVLTRVR